MVGELRYGQTSEKLQYSSRSPYLALHFEGQPGDDVDIKIDSTDGQAMAALTDSRYKPIVSNFGSHVTAVLPPSADPYPTEYFIIFQEVRRNAAMFTVSLTKVGVKSEGTAADYLTCNADTDCVAVPREGCCHNGYKDAVNKSKIGSYRAANHCKLTNPMCTQMIVDDRRVAQCNGVSHQCEMIEPNTIRCGGAGPAAHACPAGYVCKTTGVADIPGICAQE